MGKPIIMGRKTYQSIGRPLPGRANIVVTRNRDFSAEGVDVRYSLADALDLAATLTSDEAMIIGGAGLYGDAMARASRIYLTEIDADVDGDVAFPVFDRKDWAEISRDPHPKSDKDEFPHAFVILERVTLP